MILALDIGNTCIIVGGMEDGRAMFSFRLSTDLARTADEYAALSASPRRRKKRICLLLRARSSVRSFRS